MKQLIDKSAVIAEIYRRIKGLNACHADRVAGYAGEISGLERLLSFINTLETTDEDLELNSFDATVCKIGSTYLKEMDKDAIAKVLEPYKDGDNVKVIIKAKEK